MQDQSASEIDVLVVGAGPTGLTLAGELLARGVSCRIVDAGPVRSDKSRALVVQARTLELMQKAGLADKLIARGRRTASVRAFVEGREAARAALGDIGADDSPFPFLLFVSQAETERVLEERLVALGGRVERPLELIALAQHGGFATARVRGPDGERELRARFVAGCDGAHSAVRKLAGLEFKGARYPQEFVLADIRAEVPWGDGSICFFFSRAGMLVLFPFQDEGHFRIIASRARGGQDESELTLREVKAIASELMQIPTGEPAGPASPVAEPGRTQHPIDLREALWLTRFRLHHRAVDRYRSGRVFVAGDAAHIHSPAGGQGMNTGIQDAWNLGWKLALVCRGEAPEALLDSYDAERRPVGRKLLRYTDRLFAAGAARNRLIIALRNFFVPLFLPRLLGSRGLRARLFRFVSQLGIRYRHSPAVAHRDERGPRPQPGDRAPDAPLEGATVFEKLAGTGHHLLVFGAALQTAAREAATQGAVPVALHAIEGELARRRYGVAGDELVLVRPDGYVAVRSARPGDIAAWLRATYPRARS